MKHRKLIKPEDINRKQDNDYLKISQTAQIGEAFKTQKQPIVIIQTQQNFIQFINDQLDILKQWLNGPFKKYVINYGGHDQKNLNCPINQQYKQNQNEIGIVLPQIQQHRNEISLKNQNKIYNLSLYNENEKNHFNTIKEKLVKHSQECKTKLNKNEFNNIKNKCNCKKQDEIFESIDTLVMELSQFSVEKKQGNKMIQEKTIHYEQDLFLQDLDNLIKNKELATKLKKHQIFPIVKLNQQIGIHEDRLLHNTGQNWTSSMVDGYANYLFGIDERKYFSLSKKEREMYNRLFIFTSDFITNCNLSSPPLKEKWLLLMLQRLDTFSTIQYQFWLIYQRIAFVVNKNNSHWYMVTLDLTERYINVYDSLNSDPQHYNKVGELLSYLFYELQKNQLKEQNIQEHQYQFKIYVKKNFLHQNDCYSCGYYTCIALQYFSNLDKQKTYKDKQEIKKILNSILLYDQN